MKAKINKPKSKLDYEPPKKIVYKTTSFRLPEKLLQELDTWVEESTDESTSGSVNDLVRQIVEWALENKGARK